MGNLQLNKNEDDYHKILDAKWVVGTLHDYIQKNNNNNNNDTNVTNNILTHLISYIKTEAQSAEEMLQAIKSKRIPLSGLDSQGRNLLHYALMLNLSIKNSLSNSMLDDTLVDNYGKTPLDYEELLNKIYSLARSVILDPSSLVYKFNILNENGLMKSK